MTDVDTIVLGGGEAHTAQDIVTATGSLSARRPRAMKVSSP
jgi:hypothetical protein